MPGKNQNITTISDKGAVLFSNRLQIPYDFFEKARSEKNPNLVKVVTYTNEKRKSINSDVHRYLFGSDTV
jgi:hypothetical protein